MKKTIIAFMVIVGLSVSAFADKIGYNCVPVSIINMHTELEYKLTEDQIKKTTQAGFVLDTTNRTIIDNDNESFKYIGSSKGADIYVNDAKDIYVYFHESYKGKKYQYVYMNVIENPAALIKMACETNPFF